MSAINTIVGISKAADKWLKLESLQIATLQFFIIGKISFRLKLSSAVHCLLNLEFKISSNIFCSSSFLPVARKNLQLFNLLDTSLINSINILEGILLVGPEPPIPSSIFI